MTLARIARHKDLFLRVQALKFGECHLGRPANLAAEGSPHVTAAPESKLRICFFPAQ